MSHVCAEFLKYVPRVCRNPGRVKCGGVLQDAPQDKAVHARLVDEDLGSLRSRGEERERGWLTLIP